MDKYIAEMWEENKSELEKILTQIVNNPIYSELDLEWTITYELLFKLMLRNVFVDDFHRVFDPDKVTVIDNGSYQGTIMIFFPFRESEPSATDYFYTGVDYGSCSGCDTLKRAIDDNFETDKSQVVKDLMTICLHMAQRIQRCYTFSMFYGEDE